MGVNATLVEPGPLTDLHFPALGIFPAEIPGEIEEGRFRFRARQRKASPFDFATLGAHHKIRFSWHLFEVYELKTGFEIECIGAPGVTAAQEAVRLLQAMLYLRGVPPFVLPYTLTQSMDMIAGINSRDSAVLSPKLSEAELVGHRTADGLVKAWLHEPVFRVQSVFDRPATSEETFRQAARDVETWMSLESQFPALGTARKALQTAPMIPDLGSSLLHAWQGTESMFPSVTTEISFRLSLLIAQLAAPVDADRHATYRAAKLSYGKRSKAAHGNIGKLVHDDWQTAWNLLALCMRGCLVRNSLPRKTSLRLSYCVSRPEFEQWLGISRGGF